MNVTHAPPLASFAVAPLDIVVMAAGQGTRMHSQTPKVLQLLGDRSLLAHVLHTCHALQPRSVILVTGHQAEEVQNAAYTSWPGASRQLRCVVQSPQLGTGHAVQQAVPHMPDDGLTLVLSGDVPFIAATTLQRLLRLCVGAGPGMQYAVPALLSTRLEHPLGYGRVVRDPVDAQSVLQIVEQKDASEQQQTIEEIYSGMMAVPSKALKQWLARLDQNNAQGEFYLTDIVRHAVADGVAVRALCIAEHWQVEGVNSPTQLARLERALQARQAQALLDAGVRLRDPARLDIRGQLQCAADVEIDVNCVFEGQVVLDVGVRIGPNCVLRNVNIAAGTHVHAFSHLDGATIGQRASIGPFARLRPGARLADEVHIGNFVEVKDSRLGKGSKANHLAYLGNAEVGAGVNYGAGAITANYDGAHKHSTVIEDAVHIGSNSVLVAPVTIGAGGTVAAGSTITHSTQPRALTIARARQRSVLGWQRPQKPKRAAPPGPAD